MPPGVIRPYPSCSRADGGAVDAAHQRYELRHGDAGPVDDDLLASFHPLDDARQVPLGVVHVAVHALRRHRSTSRFANSLST